MKKQLQELRNLSTENMVSAKGNDIPNQFIIKINGMKIFQSYGTIMAGTKDNDIYINNNECNFTKTTSKYLSMFLNDHTEISYNRKKLFKFIEKANEILEVNGDELVKIDIREYNK